MLTVTGPLHFLMIPCDPSFDPHVKTLGEVRSSSLKEQKLNYQTAADMEHPFLFCDKLFNNLCMNIQGTQDYILQRTLMKNFH